MNINQNKTLFHRAFMDSGAHTARAVHPPDASLHTSHFEQFLSLTGCDKQTEDRILPCRRQQSSSTIIEASQKVFWDLDPSVRWTWQPAIDGDLISRRPIDAWKSGRWHKVRMLAGFTHNDGAYFDSPSMTSSEEFTQFFATLLPQLSPEDLRTLDQLYTDPLLVADSLYVETRNISAGSQFKRDEAAYGQYANTCPVRQTAYLGSSATNPPIFLCHWGVNVSMLRGANHGDQTRYQTYNPEVRSISPVQDAIAGTLHAYVTSFIVSGDPNHVSGRFPDRPRWHAFASPNEGTPGQTMVLGMGNDERADGSHVGVMAQSVSDTFAQEECRFWWKQSENQED